MTERISPPSPEEEFEFSDEELRLAAELRDALDGRTLDGDASLSGDAVSSETRRLVETARLVQVGRDFELGEERARALGASLGFDAEPETEIGSSVATGESKVIRLFRRALIPVSLAAVALFSFGIVSTRNSSGPEASRSEWSPEGERSAKVADGAVTPFPEPSSELLAAQAEALSAALGDSNAAKRERLERELALYRRDVLARWERRGR